VRRRQGKEAPPIEQSRWTEHKEEERADDANASSELTVPVHWLMTTSTQFMSTDMS
jgi:hypothetical protein